MDMDTNSYSITHLFRIFSASLAVALILGLSVSASTDGSLISAALIAALSVTATMLLTFFLLLRPSHQSLSNISIALKDNEELHSTELSKIQRNPLICHLQRALNNYFDEFTLLANNLSKNGNTIATGSAEVSSFVDSLNQTIQNQTDPPPDF